jgi:hypothetical protein
VRAEGACGNSTCANVTVDVISSVPNGPVYFTSAITDGCVGAPATAFTVNAASGAAYYRWTSGQAGVRFNGNPSPYETSVPTVNVTFVSLPASGSSGWSICVFGTNACGNTNTICTWVRAIVGLPSPVIGSVTGCPGSSGNAYSVPAVAGAATYVWSATGGITIAGNGASAITVNFAPGFVSGTLSVHGQTSCGYNGPDRTITITKAPVIPGIITGPAYPCPNASSIFSIAAVPGAASYTWTTSVPGAVVTGTSASCSIQFPSGIPGGSTVSVVANSSCPFSSPVRSKGIANGLPGVPLVINGPASGQCGQTGVSYSISPVAMALSYTWNTSCGTISGPNNLSAITVDWPSSFAGCVVSVSATNACGTGLPRNLSVLASPGIPAAIAGNASPCIGGVENYSTAGSAGATGFTWTVPAGTTILGPSNGSSILVQWGSVSSNITVRASNGCGNSGVRSLACTISCRMNQVNSAAPFSATVYPNPVINKAVLKFSSSEASHCRLSLLDLAGRKVLESETTSVEGENMIELDFSNFAKGIYMLHLESGADQQVNRIVVE